MEDVRASPRVDDVRPREEAGISLAIVAVTNDADSRTGGDVESCPSERPASATERKVAWHGATKVHHTFTEIDALGHAWLDNGRIAPATTTPTTVTRSGVHGAVIWKTPPVQRMDRGI